MQVAFGAHSVYFGMEADLFEIYLVDVTLVCKLCNLIFVNIFAMTCFMMILNLVVLGLLLALRNMRRQFM